jgi:hypothetical protein
VKTIQQHGATPAVAKGQAHPRLENTQAHTTRIPTSIRLDDISPPSERRRHDCYGRSSSGRSKQIKKPTIRGAHNTDKVSGPPPRHPAAPPCPTDRQHHLPGPLSRLTTARTRATTPHATATSSPSCTRQTTRRPRPPYHIRGRRPGLKVKPPPLRRAN